jgi:hypothetical protein
VNIAVVSMNKKRRTMLAVLCCAVLTAAAVGIGLPILAGARARPHGFQGDNFIRHIGQALQIYMDQTHAEVLPPNLKVVSDFLQMDSPKRLVSYRGVPYARIRYVGAGVPTNAPPLTPVLLYDYERRKGAPPRGVVRYLNQQWDIVEGDEWARLWQAAAPAKWE